MAQTEIKTKLPTTIDKHMLFLVWELDEFAVLITPLILSLMVKQILLGLIVGVVLMQLYMRLKRHKPNNYLFHLSWKWGIVKVKNVPPAHIKEFIE